MNLHEYCLNKGLLDVIEAWDDETPMEQVALRSHKKRQLKCPVCGTTKRQNLGSIVNLPKFKFHCVRCNSFGKWCEENNSGWLKYWDYEQNKITPYEVDLCAGKHVYFKCSRGIHESELTRIADITHDGFTYRCRKCNSFGQWCTDNNLPDLLDRWDDTKNKCDPYSVSFSSAKKWYFKCPKGIHESEPKMLSNVIKQEGSRRCCQCLSFAQTLIDKYGEDYFNSIWSEKNTKDPYRLARRSETKAWFNCIENPSHPPFHMSCSNYSKGERCPVCRVVNITSRLQNMVMNYITNNYNYTLLHENQCTLSPINPFTNYRLYYDNEIKELKIIIEVMGVQHYKITYFAQKGAEAKNMGIEEYFEYSQLIDKFKKQFVLDNGYFYLAIPYWTEETEEYKTLIDDAIRKQIKCLQTNP